MKIWFDKHKSGSKEFEVGDLVLKWDHPHDEKGKHTKFQNLGICPFQITEKLGPSTYKLHDCRGGKRICQLMVWFSNLILLDAFKVSVHK